MSDLPRPHRELTALLEPKGIPRVFTLRAQHVRCLRDAPYVGTRDSILRALEQTKKGEGPWGFHRALAALYLSTFF